MGKIFVELRMGLSSEHIFLRPLTLDNAAVLLKLRLRNREFLRPWEPIQPEDQYTLHRQQELIQQAVAHWGNGSGYSFGIFLTERDTLIGRVSLSNVVRGAWQNCTIGYFLDEQQNGRGYMTEAVRLAVKFALTEADLHRVQASVLPRNLGSIRVIEKVGFRYEGLAEYYLKINDVWEHHNIYSITKENWL